MIASFFMSSTFAIAGAIKARGEFPLWIACRGARESKAQLRHFHDFAGQLRSLDHLDDWVLHAWGFVTERDDFSLNA
jgi:hypothetical protein